MRIMCSLAELNDYNAGLFEAPGPSMCYMIGARR